MDWYGEVYADPAALAKIEQTWTWTDMGSGQFANAGFGQAANFRNPYYVDLSGKYQWPDNPIDVAGYNPKCYTKTALASLPSPWDMFFYVGGPGRNALPAFPGAANCPKELKSP